jgi:hypothetical protein
MQHGKTQVMDLTADPKHLAVTKAITAGKIQASDVEWSQVDGIPSEWTGPIRWDHPNAAHVEILDHHAGLVKSARKKVCIVGYAENSRHMAWWDDPDCEIWGVNQLYRFIPKADRWFQIHKDWDDETKWAPGANQRQFMQEAPIPIYMIDHLDEIPTSVRYPIERVMAECKIHDYFTSTIAFMVALAIAEGFQEIGIYGIDLIIGREYFFEKACVEYLLGIANERGIHVHKPEGCALLWQSHRYGYQQEPDYGFYSLAKLKKRSAQLSEQVTLMRDEVKVWQGRIEETEWVIKRLNDEAKVAMEKHIDELRTNMDKALNRLYMHDGAQQEVQRMYDILEVRSRGGQVE